MKKQLEDTRGWWPWHYYPGRYELGHGSTAAWVACTYVDKPWMHLGVSLGKYDLQKYAAAAEVTLGNGESIIFWYDA